MDAPTVFQGRTEPGPIRSTLDVKRLLGEAVARAAEALAGGAGRGPLPEGLRQRATLVEVPREPGFGDFASSAALALAGFLRRPPLEVASEIARAVRTAAPLPLQEVSVAGPGFVNMRLKPSWLFEVAARLATDGPQAAVPDVGRGRRVLLEFVSANPTGPMNVVNARAAAVGDALARLLEATGFSVTREYYVNDAGRQAALFAQSVAARMAELLGQAAEIPEGGYRGEYVRDLAREILESRPELASMPHAERLQALQREAVDRMVARQREDLGRFGVVYDVWFRERSLHAGGEVRRALELLAQRGHLYEAEGARWLRSTAFGDDKDRVVVKSDGELTYLAADIAYHLNKLERGYDLLIDIWGPDHHGYVARVKAALAALGFDPGRLEVIILQLVTLTRSGESVRMSKRAGEFVTMRELLDEVGADAARYFFLSRSPDSPLEFDVDLAKLASMENPVYYVQYAHARICSVFRQAQAEGVEVPERVQPADLEVLQAPLEVAVLRALAQYPEEVQGAALRREPHRVVEYLYSLASAFHGFYHEHRVLEADPALRRGRLGLCLACQRVLAHGLSLLGIGAPQRM